MLPETRDNLDRWHAFIGEEFNNVVVFNFHDFDTLVRWTSFCPPNFAR
jgi:hypothetical protein